MNGDESSNGREPLTEADMYVSRDRTPASHADLDFIAGARQDIPRLIAELHRLRDELAGRS